MKKTMTNAEKIEKIKSERKQLLEMTKNSIRDNRENLTAEIDQLFQTLKQDEKSVKKYEALLNAKSLIEDLIEQILDADSVEDIISIRKKLNYYINKIKKELLNRGIDKQELLKYQELVGGIRKDIAKCVRFLKRNEAIEVIDSTFSIDDLSEGEQMFLDNLIKKELRYNKSYLNAKTKEVKDEKPVISAVKEDSLSEPTKVEEEVVSVGNDSTANDVVIETFSLLNDNNVQLGGSYREKVDVLVDKANEHMASVDELISDAKKLICASEFEYSSQDVDNIISEVKSLSMEESTPNDNAVPEVKSIVTEESASIDSTSKRVVPMTVERTLENDSFNTKLDILVDSANRHIADLDKLIADAKELIGGSSHQVPNYDNHIATDNIFDSNEVISAPHSTHEEVHSSVDLVPAGITNCAKVDILAAAANKHLAEVDELIHESRQLIGEPAYKYGSEIIDGIIAEVKGDKAHENVDAVGFELPSSSISEPEVMQDGNEEQVQLDNDFMDFVGEEDAAFVSRMIPKYRKHYQIRRTHEYSGTISEDLLTLLKNIPTYVHNRGCIKRMENDTRYYCGGDLAGYIDYLRRKTSLKYALKMIFDKSYFNSLEGEYLNDHEKCVSWVVDYCNRDEYSYLYPQKIKTL